MVAVGNSQTINLQTSDTTNGLFRLYVPTGQAA